MIVQPTCECSFVGGCSCVDLSLKWKRMLRLSLKLVELQCRTSTCLLMIALRSISTGQPRAAPECSEYTRTQADSIRFGRSTESCNRFTYLSSAFGLFHCAPRPRPRSRSRSVTSTIALRCGFSPGRLTTTMSTLVSVSVLTRWL